MTMAHATDTPEFTALAAKMQPSMTATGWHIHKAHAVQVDRFQVLGERGYAPVERRMGNRFTPTMDDRTPAPGTWDDADLAWMHSQLDPEIKTTLGFQP